MAPLPRLLPVLSTLFHLPFWGSDPAIAEVPPSPPAQLPKPRTTERLEQRKILFAHHAVGADMLTGLRDLLAIHPQVHLNLARQGDGSGYLIDVWIGRNGDPEAKLAEFSTLLAGHLGEEVDIAICKLGPADFPPGADPEAIFNCYRRIMDRLAADHPRIRFAHVTVPLTARQDGWRSVLKRLLRRPVPGVEDNLARSRFNEALRRRYAGKVFDLAAVESTWPDGRRQTVVYGGEAGYALVPVYTDGGGHLNAVGRRLAAERFLAFLTSLG